MQCMFDGKGMSGKASHGHASDQAVGVEELCAGCRGSNLGLVQGSPIGWITEAIEGQSR
jgi:hypothetical protein